MRRPVAPFLVALLPLCFAACGKPGPRPIAEMADSRTERPPVASAVVGLDAGAVDAEAPEAVSARGSRIVSLLDAGKYGEVRAQFDDAMTKAVPTDEALGALWTGLQQKSGRYKRTLFVTESVAAVYRIVLVTCEFEQGPLDVKLVFDRSNKVAGFFYVPTHHPDAYGPRPQTPKPPFPYEAREVTYESPRERVTLAGTLTLPRGDGPFPAVILISGSGPQDRDETLFGHKPFLILADRLTRRGIAVLRVDDRSVGKSGPENPNATIETHATDVEAGVAFLRTQKEIDPKRVGLVGHSEGGIIAAVVASRSKDVSFIVSLAGTGLPGSEINPLQVEAILRANGGTSEEGIKTMVAAQRKIMALVAKDAGDQALRAAVDEAMAAAKKYVPDAEKPTAQAALEAELAMLQTAWFKGFVRLDPRAYWSKVTVPVLAIIGDKDTQVPADKNLGEIKAALARAKNKDATTEKLPGLNHLFQNATTGHPDEYPKIQETFDPKTLDRVSDWLASRAKI